LRMTALSFISLTVLFALCGCASSGHYATATFDRRFSFPADHASHDDFQTEWWYFTGHLELEDKSETGFELVFFRRKTEHLFRMGLPVWWFANPAYVSHFAVTDPIKNAFKFDERIGLRMPLKGGASSDRLLVWSEDWRAEAFANGNIRLSAKMKDYSIDLILAPKKLPILHGEEGLSRKGSKGTLGYYYSITRLEVSGYFMRNGENMQVKAGQAWMDHEMFSGSISPDVSGWDWFSIQLDDGSDLMACLLRRDDGTLDPFSYGTLIRPDGSVFRFMKDEFSAVELEQWTSRKTQITYPIRWRILLPAESLDLILEAVMPDQELTPVATEIDYWEGAMRVIGTKGGSPIKGKAYLEMSGRGEKFKI